MGGTGLLHKIRGANPKVGTPHFVEQGRWPVVTKPRQGAEKAKVEGGVERYL